MTIRSAVLDAMLAAGCSAEQIVAAVKADSVVEAEADAARREKDRLRKREQRAAEKAAKSTVASNASHGHSGTAMDGADILSSPEVSPQTPFPNPSNPKTPSPPKGGSVPVGFDRFWVLFPNKVGKADAIKAFVKASQRIDLDTMFAALDRYAHKADDRPWCNPSTWLNQDRWTDQPANVVPMARGSPGLSMNDFLGAVIDQQERNNAGPDAEIESYPPAARLLR